MREISSGVLAFFDVRGIVRGMKRSHRERAQDCVARACVESAKEARESERKWWRQEILKILDLPENEIISHLIRVSEKRN